MLTALLYGLAASSALVIGAAIGARWDPPKPVTAVLLAFASGALISALAFELFEESYELGGAWRSGLSLLAGAGTFVVVDTVLDRRTAGAPGPEGRGMMAGAKTGAVGLALLAAATLDGVPENLALGVSLAEGASLPLLIAIFASNLPEALVGAVSMREGGRPAPSVFGIWAACALLLVAAVVLGRGISGSLGDAGLSIALGYAGGAVLAALADTLMPEAFEHGRPVNAMATTAGFFLSFMLAT